MYITMNNKVILKRKKIVGELKLLDLNNYFKTGTIMKGNGKKINIFITETGQNPEKHPYTFSQLFLTKLSKEFDEERRFPPQ